MTIFRTIALALTLATPATAQEVAIGIDRYVLPLRRADLHPATPTAARRVLARIDRAALAVCGASAGSLRALTLAVRASACWRESIDGVRRRIDDPLLVRIWPDTGSGDR